MSALEPATASDLREWGAPAPPTWNLLEWAWLALIVGVPGGVVALAAGLALGWAVAALALVAYGALVLWWFTRQGRTALAGLGRVREMEERAAPRLFNLARGLATQLGLQPPRLLVGGDDQPNAFACRVRGPVILVTQGLLDTYTRTELEAVVTHCLIRLSGGEHRRAVVGAALGGLAGPAGVAHHHDVDLRTVALTRYPPALAGAIAGAAPVGGTRAAFWFVPTAAGANAPDARERSLNDL